MNHMTVFKVLSIWENAINLLPFKTWKSFVHICIWYCHLL